MKYVTPDRIFSSKPRENTDENELVRRAQKDMSQFVVLYDLYVQRVYRFLLARTADIAVAEDLTSQTFLSAMEKLPSYHSNSAFLPWLLTIARNKQIDYFRKYQRRVDLELDENLVENQPDLVNNLIQKERRRALNQMIAELPEKDSELLILRLAGQMSFAEMGEYLHQNSEKVKKAYYRLIERLKAGMEVSHE
jgi:RNA polymerase sigma-70 factor, ECF subfamily